MMSRTGHQSTRQSAGNPHDNRTVAHFDSEVPDPETPKPRRRFLLSRLGGRKDRSVSGSEPSGPSGLDERENYHHLAQPPSRHRHQYGNTGERGPLSNLTSRRSGSPIQNGGPTTMFDANQSVLDSGAATRSSIVDNMVLSLDQLGDPFSVNMFNLEPNGTSSDCDRNTPFFGQLGTYSPPHETTPSRQLHRTATTASVRAGACRVSLDADAMYSRFEVDFDTQISGFDRSPQRRPTGLEIDITGRTGTGPTVKGPAVGGDNVIDDIDDEAAPTPTIPAGPRTLIVSPSFGIPIVAADVVAAMEAESRGTAGLGLGLGMDRPVTAVDRSDRLAVMMATMPVQPTEIAAIGFSQGQNQADATSSAKTTRAPRPKRPTLLQRVFGTTTGSDAGGGVGDNSRVRPDDDQQHPQVLMVPTSATDAQPTPGLGTSPSAFRTMTGQGTGGVGRVADVDGDEDPTDRHNGKTSATNTSRNVPSGPGAGPLAAIRSTHVRPVDGEDGCDGFFDSTQPGLSLSTPSDTASIFASAVSVSPAATPTAIVPEFGSGPLSINRAAFSVDATNDPAPLPSRSPSHTRPGSPVKDTLSPSLLSRTEAVPVPGPDTVFASDGSAVDIAKSGPDAVRPSNGFAATASDTSDHHNPFEIHTLPAASQSRPGLPSLPAELSHATNPSVDPPLISPSFFTGVFAHLSRGRTRTLSSSSPTVAPAANGSSSDDKSTTMSPQSVTYNSSSTSQRVMSSQLPPTLPPTVPAQSPASASTPSLLKKPSSFFRRRKKSAVIDTESSIAFLDGTSSEAVPPVPILPIARPGATGSDPGPSTSLGRDTVVPLGSPRTPTQARSFGPVPVPLDSIRPEPKYSALPPHLSSGRVPMSPLRSASLGSSGSPSGLGATPSQHSITPRKSTSSASATPQLTPRQVASTATKNGSPSPLPSPLPPSDPVATSPQAVSRERSPPTQTGVSPQSTPAQSSLPNETAESTSRVTPLVLSTSPTIAVHIPMSPLFAPGRSLLSDSPVKKTSTAHKPAPVSAARVSLQVPRPGRSAPRRTDVDDSDLDRGLDSACTTDTAYPNDEGTWAPATSPVDGFARSGASQWSRSPKSEADDISVQTLVVNPTAGAGETGNDDEDDEFFDVQTGGTVPADVANETAMSMDVHPATGDSTVLMLDRSNSIVLPDRADTAQSDHEGGVSVVPVTASPDMPGSFDFDVSVFASAQVGIEMGDGREIGGGIGRLVDDWNANARPDRRSPGAGGIDRSLTVTSTNRSNGSGGTVTSRSYPAKYRVISGPCPGPSDENVDPVRSANDADNGSSTDVDDADDAIANAGVSGISLGFADRPIHETNDCPDLSQDRPLERTIEHNPAGRGQRQDCQTDARDSSHSGNRDGRGAYISVSQPSPATLPRSNNVDREVVTDDHRQEHSEPVSRGSIPSVTAEPNTSKSAAIVDRARSSVIGSTTSSNGPVSRPANTAAQDTAANGTSTPMISDEISDRADHRHSHDQRLPNRTENTVGLSAATSGMKSASPSPSTPAGPTRSGAASPAFVRASDTTTPSPRFRLRNVAHPQSNAGSRSGTPTRLDIPQVRLSVPGSLGSSALVLAPSPPGSPAFDLTRPDSNAGNSELPPFGQLPSAALHSISHRGSNSSTPSTVSTSSHLRGKANNDGLSLGRAEDGWITPDRPTERVWIEPSDDEADASELLPVEDDDFEGGSDAQPTNPTTDRHREAVPDPDSLVPTDEDIRRARLIMAGDDSVVLPNRAAGWLGDQTPLQTRTRIAFMSLFDFSRTSILSAFRRLCSSIIFRAESQQLDRIVDAFSNRWVECNRRHGFRSVDVVHAITYSMLMLNTDLHTADVASKMTQKQFVRNTMPALVAEWACVDDADGQSLNADGLEPDYESGLFADKKRKNRLSRLADRDGPMSPRIGPPIVDSNGDSLLLVDGPRPTTSRTWEAMLEEVLRQSFLSIQREKLPLHGTSGAGIGVMFSPSGSVGSLNSLTSPSSASLAIVSAGLRRTPSVLSRTSEAGSASVRTVASRWRRPRVPGSAGGTIGLSGAASASGVLSGRPSFDDDWRHGRGSIRSGSVADHFAAGDDEVVGTVRGFGFAQAIREENENGCAGQDQRQSVDNTGAPHSQAAPVSDIMATLELAGPPWVKEGLVYHRPHTDRVKTGASSSLRAAISERKSKNKNWIDTFAVVQRGWLRLFSFGGKPVKAVKQRKPKPEKVKSKDKGLKDSSDSVGAEIPGSPNSASTSTVAVPASLGPATVVGGGNWAETAEPVAQFPLRHAVAAALPVPFSSGRPYVWALTLPSGQSHLFHAGTAEVVAEWVWAVNYWAGRLSRPPLVGGVSSAEYGWGGLDLVVLEEAEAEGMGRMGPTVTPQTAVTERPPSSSVRSFLSRRSHRRMRSGSAGASIASSIDTVQAPTPTMPSQTAPTTPLSTHPPASALTSPPSRFPLPSQRMNISEWTPPLPSLTESDLPEPEQLVSLIEYVRKVEIDLDRHHRLRRHVAAAFGLREGHFNAPVRAIPAGSSLFAGSVVSFNSNGGAGGGQPSSSSSSVVSSPIVGPRSVSVSALTPPSSSAASSSASPFSKPSPSLASNGARAMANWERKCRHLLAETVRFEVYVDALTRAATERERLVNTVAK